MNPVVPDRHVGIYSITHDLKPFAGGCPQEEGPCKGTTRIVGILCWNVMKSAHF